MNLITYKKYNHLFNINLLASLTTSAVFHVALVLCSLFWWTAEPAARASRSEDVYKQLEIHSVASPTLYKKESFMDDVSLEETNAEKQYILEEFFQNILEEEPLPEEDLLPLVIAEEPPVAPEYGKGFFDVINTTDAFSTITSEKMAGWRNW